MTIHSRNDPFVALMPSGEGAMWDRKRQRDMVQRRAAFGSSLQRVMKNWGKRDQGDVGSAFRSVLQGLRVQALGVSIYFD